ncbi:hypothetical protein IFM89_007742 [Coptis chinensis]|uniref:ENHANCER OF AG-4 protein 2 n=1 Tax=Coptis chinensis TaxID=261450 RepID=A0A835IV96_9MAGN|nr:hypothetical protein IFM89_007742 [Coptis chinensis]
MAPGRNKRGANRGGKMKNQLVLGDLVLAKVKGFPAWPAKVSRPEDWDRIPDPRKYFVQFFGTEEIAFVAPTDIQQFTSEAKNKLLARCQGKTVKDFSRAVKEICEAFEELQRNNSNSCGEKINKTSLAGVASVDGGEDEFEGKVDRVGMKGAVGNQTSGDEMCGLERCSHRQEESVVQDIKPGIFGDSPVRSVRKENSTKGNHLSENEGDSHSGSIDGENDDGGQKFVTNGQKSRKEFSVMKKIPTKHDVPGGKFDLPGSGEHLKYGEERRSASYERSDFSKPAKDTGRGNKAKGIVKTEKHFTGGDKTCGVQISKDSFDNTDQKQRSEIRDKKHTLVTDVDSHPAKRLKRESFDTAAITKPILKTGKVILHAQVLLFITKMINIQTTKRHRQAFEASFDSATAHADKNTNVKGLDSHKSERLSSNHGRHLVNHVPFRRRAVRLCDDDDDDVCTTPVHCESQNTSMHKSSSHGQQDNEDHLAQSIPLKVEISHVKSNAVSPSPNQIEQNSPKKMSHSYHSPQKLESQNLTPKQDRAALHLPKVVLGLPSMAKLVEYRTIKPQSKASSTAPLKKPQSGGAKGSHTQVATQKNRPTISAEKSKNTPKANLQTGEVSFTEESFTEMDRLFLERLEADRDDRSVSSTMDAKFADSVTSMKHLIAAAQAKRREAHSHSLLIEHRTPVSVSTAQAPGSVSPVSAVQSFPFGTSITMQQDAKGLYDQTSLTSPSSHVRQFKSQQVDQEECEEGRISSGQHAPGGSLSGGTEAAVARDAFEGMIETLSRTKESIGRATRLAIDCAKYGIASEVVELLIRKLESEASFHRRVDLFFLVDSITQCSHSQKGIAGASYIPTVQAALPRLLGAAAPAGTGARENRRQCLKVLRLWLERKIFPDSLLRRYMDDIGVSNDDMTAGFHLRRPSRAERAIDDPIREMEGMLVDEYGSNATFELPGLLSSRVLDDEEDLSGGLGNVLGDESTMGAVHSQEEPDACAVTPVDRRHRILEDVDGELEMEDVSGSLRDEKHIDHNDSFNLESASYDLLGSPPLPLDSPPPPPPLPSSPPPPPPPSSPSPPPPPPPPLSSQPLPFSLTAPGALTSLTPSHSLLPQQSMASQPSLPPQPSPQQGIPPQPSVSSSSTPMGYQPPLHQEYCRTPSGNQLIQMAGSSPHPGPVTGPLAKNETFSTPSSSIVPAGMPSRHDPSGFASSRTSEFGQSEMYPTPQNSQTNQPFQAGNTPFAQRPYHQIPPAQAPSTYLGYTKPTSQHQMQQQFPHSYPVSSFPNGRRQYVVDEQWKMPSSDRNPDNQHAGWLGGGRPQCSGPPYVQDGFFRQPMGSQPTNSMGFQLPAQNNLAPGAPMPVPPGHGAGHMLPDISARSSWRPA